MHTLRSLSVLNMSPPQIPDDFELVLAAFGR